MRRGGLGEVRRLAREVVSEAVEALQAIEVRDPFAVRCAVEALQLAVSFASAVSAAVEASGERDEIQRMGSPGKR